MFSGTAASQLIPLAISPIISRIYTPAELGKFAFVLTLATILSILSTGRLEQAIVLPKVDAKAEIIFFTAFWLNIIVCVLAFLIFLSFLSYFNDLLNYQETPYLILFAPLIGMLLGLNNLLTYTHNREKSFKTIATAAITRTSILSVLQLLLSALNSLGILLSDSIGRIVANLYMFYKKGFSAVKRYHKSEVKQVLHEYSDFPKYSMPNALLNSVSSNTPILLIKALYTAQQTGFYSWSYKIIQMPMGLIVNSVHQVFYREAVEHYNNDRSLFPFVVKTYKQLFAVGIVPYVLVAILSPAMFSFVFGAEWREAGEYTRILVPWLFLGFLNSPISSLILVYNRQKQYLRYEALLLVFRFSSILLGYFIYDSVIVSLFMFMMVGVVFNLYMIYYYLKLAKSTK